MSKKVSLTLSKAKDVLSIVESAIHLTEEFLRHDDWDDWMTKKQKEKYLRRDAHNLRIKEILKKAIKEAE